jgi:tRNA threonylcarbamoyladenosine biosynthesis protein TsaE
LITFENGLKTNLADLMATQALASALAKELVPGLTVYLHGDLGAGKTTLVRAMLHSLGYAGSIKSPTFTLVEAYSVNSLDIFHFDLYRLTDSAELEFIGIRDYHTPSAVCIFEWAYKGMGYIPAADIEITLDFLQTGRSAALIANTTKGLDVLQKMTIG